MAVAARVRIIDVRALVDRDASERAIEAASLGIREAADALRRSGLVALPTETVYGLGARALDPTALRRIFAAKRRPASHPLIAHVLDLDGARVVASDVERARVLTDALWPGPLTVVLPRRDDVPAELSGGLPTVAVRAPAHPVARALLDALREPIAAPSANRFQHVSPTQAEHVVRSLGDAVDIVLDGGPTTRGIESTVVELIGRPRLLRLGPISAAQLLAYLPDLDPTPPLVADTDARTSPGLDARHYAPSVPTSLFDAVPAWRRADGALLCGSAHEQSAIDAGLVTIVLPDDPERYATGLYAALHELDARGLSHIHIQAPPRGSAWDAVRDRVTRATG